MRKYRIFLSPDEYELTVDPATGYIVSVLMFPNGQCSNLTELKFTELDVYTQRELNTRLHNLSTTRGKQTEA